MKKLLRVQPKPPLHWVGDGFPVRSIFDYNGLGRELSPFLLLDYAEPTHFSPASRPRGVGAHPHRGFETVTIAYQGQLAHRDSSGGGGTIGPGDVQWMTAGAGVIHEEFHSPEFTQSGGTLQMVQLWVNLPARDKTAKPGYQAILNERIPVVPLAGGGQVRVIAGDYAGARGPAKTFTPVNLWDIKLNAGNEARFPLPEGSTTALLVLEGAIRFGDSVAGPGELAVFSREGTELSFTADADAKLLVMNGEPINEPVVGAGPFVMNNRAEIRQAMEDYHSGRMGSLVA